jgi:MoxR-like ATPase
MTAPVITARIQQLGRELCAGLHEREEAMTVALLAVLAGQSVFLLGPPGTAKSLMARRLSCAFNDSKHFEYLMQKFSTPEEIFGPIDISELKQGNYKRKTKGYLPEADFAFLDEIWKSNPAILNTLLTIINEKIFRNGVEEVKVPLKALIGASNELPQTGQGLEALWDRFLVRLEVPPMSDRASFEALLQSRAVKAEIKVDKQLAISTEEWLDWQQGIDTVKLSAETLQVIHAVKVQLNELETQRKADNRSHEQSYYVSDRRWLRAVTLLKSSAYFSGRSVTSPLDTLMLRHCLWSSLENKAQIQGVVEAAIGAGFVSGINLAEIDDLLERAEALLVENSTKDDRAPLVKQLMKTDDVMVDYEKVLTGKLVYTRSNVEKSLLSSNNELLETTLQENIRHVKARSLQIKQLINLALNPAPKPTPKKEVVTPPENKGSFWMTFG